MIFTKKPVIVLIIIVLIIPLSACEDNVTIYDTVDAINANESIYSGLIGLFTIHAEAQDETTIAVVFKAEREELSIPEVARAISDETTSDFKAAVLSMRNSGISNASIVLEFLDTNGDMFFSRSFS